MLPKFYYDYKTTSLEKGLNSLAESVSNMYLVEARSHFDDFNLKHNVTLNLLDSEGSIVYSPSNFIRFIDDGILEQPIGSTSLEKPIRVIIRNVKEQSSLSKVYINSKAVTFKDNPRSYTIYINAPLQPIDEASKVLFMFMPYIGLIVLLVSITGALIYSKIIAQPLLRINKVAKKMAGLDFVERCQVYGEDEIGELSISLNELSSNLENTMSELKAANSKLLKDIEKEREIESQRREFTATISHELKTPLTIVKGQLEGMIGNVGAYKDRDKYLNRSLEVLQDMEGMVREILEISKLEDNQFKPNLKMVNLTDLITRCLKELNYIAEVRNIDISIYLEEELFVEADEKLIRKAIYNVINNAVTHSGSGEKVFITLGKNEDTIKLEIENTGAHIEEKEFEALFKPFYRIEKSRNRNTGGSGLGLYIVKKILDAHRLKYNMCNSDIGVKFEMCF
jgi:two-component system sensor histidine kinase VanS